MLSTIGFENVFVLKADATVSIFMIILYTYVDSLTIYLFYMYFHGLHSNRCYILSSLILLF